MTSRISAAWLKSYGHDLASLVPQHFDADTFDLMQETLSLLTQHGKHDWQVGWDSAKRRAGATHFQTKRITYSRVLMPKYPLAVQWQVMLHEVAHALLGPRHGHNQTWKDTVRALGGTPSVTLSPELPSAPARWVGVCPQCSKKRELHSAPRRVVSCGNCSRTFNRNLILRWHLHGTETIPPGGYSKELRRLGLVSSPRQRHAS